MNKIEFIYSLFKECNFTVCTDTRKITANSLFIALKGPNFDANLLCEEALQKGCRYAITDNPNNTKSQQIFLVEDGLKCLQDLAKYHREQLIKIPIIAVTGSNGKTTTKELITKVLEKKYKVHATPGNFNNHIGLPLTLLQLRQEHQIAVIEMGANHPGEIEELCNICLPDYGVITSIGKEHLEGFGTIEGVMKTNGELYEYLYQHSKTIFIQKDNATLVNILKQFTQYTLHDKNIICYGEKDTSNFIFGEEVENKDDIFVKFKWQTNISVNAESIIHTKLMARHNFINALCAVTIGKYFQVDDKQINTAISEYLPNKNRMQWQETKHNKIILDAYNANPTSMLAALEFFKNITLPLQKLLIIGDMFEMGEHAHQEHQDVVTWLNKNFSSQVILVGKEFFNTENSNIYNKFDTTEGALKFLEQQNITNHLILIKASRGMQLERALHHL